MGQNNNQNSTGQGFKKDDAYQTLSMINLSLIHISIQKPYILNEKSRYSDFGAIHSRDL